MVFCCLFEVLEQSVRLKHNSGELGSDLGVIPRFSESERCDLDWGLETEFGGDLLDCGLQGILIYSGLEVFHVDVFIIKFFFSFVSELLEGFAVDNVLERDSAVILGSGLGLLSLSTGLKPNEADRSFVDGVDLDVDADETEILEVLLDLQSDLIDFFIEEFIIIEDFVGELHCLIVPEEQTLILDLIPGESIPAEGYDSFSFQFVNLFFIDLLDEGVSFSIFFELDIQELSLFRKVRVFIKFGVEDGSES